MSGGHKVLAIAGVVFLLAGVFTMENWMIWYGTGLLIGCFVSKN